MIRYVIAAAAMLAVPGTLAFATEPAPTHYDIKLQLSENGAVIAAPRLTASEAEPAEFRADDGKGRGWTAQLTATRDAAQPGHIAIDWSMTVTRPLTNGGVNRRTVKTTLSLRDPGHVGFDLPATDMDGPLHVDLDVATLTPAP